MVNLFLVRYHLLEVGPLNTIRDVQLVVELSADRSKVRFCLFLFVC